MIFFDPQVVGRSVLREMFRSTYAQITKGNEMWNQLACPQGSQYAWDLNSTYVHEPPFFKTMTKDPPGVPSVKDAYCLLNFGDSITTDHISPAGNINKDSPAAKYLMEHGVDRKDFNSYGSRRGNDEVMARGTFANIRIVNKFLKGEVGPRTLHIPSQETMFIYDAAQVSMLSTLICIQFFPTRTVTSAFFLWKLRKKWTPAFCHRGDENRWIVWPWLLALVMIEFLTVVRSIVLQLSF